jgi:hypothetical protein
MIFMLINGLMIDAGVLLASRDVLGNLIGVRFFQTNGWCINHEYITTTPLGVPSVQKSLERNNWRVGLTLRRSQMFTNRPTMAHPGAARSE